MPNVTGIYSLVYAVVLLIAGHHAAPLCVICTSITIVELLQAEREISPSGFSFVCKHLRMLLPRVILLSTISEDFLHAYLHL